MCLGTLSHQFDWHFCYFCSQFPDSRNQNIHTKIGYCSTSTELSFEMLMEKVLLVVLNKKTWIPGESKKICAFLQFRPSSNPSKEDALILHLKRILIRLATEYMSQKFLMENVEAVVSVNLSFSVFFSNKGVIRKFLFSGIFIIEETLNIKSEYSVVLEEVHICKSSKNRN